MVQIQKRFFKHTLTTDFDTVGVFSHSVTAQKYGNQYVVFGANKETGARHTRYFDSPREFVIWHYHQQNFKIELDYPWENEVE